MSSSAKMWADEDECVTYMCEKIPKLARSRFELSPYLNSRKYRDARTVERHLVTFTQPIGLSDAT